MEITKPILTIYGRHDCHLCLEMIYRLEKERGVRRYDLRIINVDTDASLQQNYGNKVPVLCIGEAEICHYFLDWGALDAHLAKIS